VVRRLRIWMIGLCTLLLTGSLLQAQEVQLRASIDSSSVHIGDWIRMRVTAEYSPAIASIGPMLQDSLGRFEVLRIHASPEQIGEQSRRQTWHVRLAAFDATEGVIPPVLFRYTLQGDSTPRVASTLPIPVSVKGMEIDPQGDIKDVKPPMTPPWGFEDFLPYGILTLVVAALAAGYFYYRRRKKHAQEPERVIAHIPPHEQALYALHDLEEKRLWQQGKLKEYYSEITEIVRKFFEGRFGIIALEMTSDEIMRQMKSIPEAQPHWKEMNTFFLIADLVKFAKYESTPAEHENEMKWAYAIVQSMIPKPPVQQEREEVAADVR